MIVKSKFREFVPIVLLFIILNGFFISGRSFLERWNMSQDVVIGGNLFLFGITFLSFVIAKRGLQNENPNAFVSAVYSSMIFKFFLCIIAAVIYISYNKAAFNKPAFFTCMGLYLVYTFTEVAILTRLLKGKKNE